MAKTTNAAAEDDSTDDTAADVAAAESFTIVGDRNHNLIAQLDLKAFDAEGKQYQHLVRAAGADVTLAKEIVAAMVANWADPTGFKFRFKVSGGVRLITAVL